MPSKAGGGGNRGAGAAKADAAEAGAGAHATGGAGGRADGHISPEPTCEILYNTGLQLLLTEKPQEVGCNGDDTKDK